MPNTPPRGLMKLCQTSTVTVPVIMPASAPCMLARRQYKAHRVSGPNEAPRPAQA